jgi:reactive intermediate/imine deaminase
VATKSAVRTDRAPAPLQGAPYSQAIRWGDLVFVSGQLPLSAAGEVVGTSIEEQTEQVLSNIRAILEVAGTRMHKLVKTTVFLASHDDFIRDERRLQEARRGGPARALHRGRQGLPPGGPPGDRRDRSRVTRTGGADAAGQAASTRAISRARVASRASRVAPPGSTRSVVMPHAR